MRLTVPAARRLSFLLTGLLALLLLAGCKASVDGSGDGDGSSGGGTAPPAPLTFTLSGTATDDPLVSAAVYIHDAAGNLVGQTGTDLNGGFTWADLPAGDYRVVTEGGVVRGQPFSGSLSAWCSGSPCHVTPLTTLAVEYAERQGVSYQAALAAMLAALGLGEDPFVADLGGASPVDLEPVRNAIAGGGLSNWIDTLLDLIDQDAELPPEYTGSPPPDPTPDPDPTPGPAPTGTVALPSITPNGGYFAGPVEIALATATEGATLRYTTDGSLPTASSTAYAAPFTLNPRTAPVQVRVQGFKDGMNPSPVRQHWFLPAYTVSGTVTGYTGSGLVLSYYYGTLAIAADGGDPVPFAFEYPYPNGAPYVVSVETQPAGLTCTVTGGGNDDGSGSIDNADVSSVTVACVDQDLLAVEASRNAVQITFTGIGDTDVNRVSGNLILPLADIDNGVDIRWSSDKPELISDDGTVTTPPFDYGPAEVTLTATFTKGDVVRTREFQLIVAKEPAYFVENEKMWHTDGTYAGTEHAIWVPLAGLIPEAPDGNAYLPVLGDTVFFVSRERMSYGERVANSDGGELWGYNLATGDFDAMDIGPDALSGINGPLEWEYSGDGEDRKLRFHALDVAPGTNKITGDITIPCTDAQIWETDGSWADRGNGFRELAATKIDGCPLQQSQQIVLLTETELPDDAFKLTLDDLNDVINYEESKIVIGKLTYGETPMTSGDLAKAMLEFGDYLRPHIENQIAWLNNQIARPPEGASDSVMAGIVDARDALQQALDDYIGEDKTEAKRQEFMQRMTSSGAYVALMGEGKDPAVLAAALSAQDKADLTLRFALMAPLMVCMQQAVMDDIALTVAQQNLAARVANRINEKRRLLGEELARLQWEFVLEKEKASATNIWALKTLPDIAMSAEEMAVNRLIAAGVGAGVGIAVGVAVAVAITSSATAIFVGTTTVAGVVGFSWTVGGTTVFAALSGIAAGAAAGAFAVAVSALVIGAVSVVMLVEEAENQKAFDEAEARSQEVAALDLSNLVFNDHFGKADYYAGFSAMYAEIR